MIELLARAASSAVALVLWAVSVHHTPATACGTRDGIAYCRYAGDPASTRVVYFLHGFGNDPGAWSWNSVTRRIEERWKATGAVRPHVVALSLGGAWWYAGPGDGRRLSALARRLEAEVLPGPPSERVLYGDSMGGHNALRWAMDSPGEFARLALICPAVPPSFAGGAPGGRRLLRAAAEALIGGRYRAADAAVPSPLAAVRRGAVPRVHVAVSPRDEYGFYPGGLELARRLAEDPAADVSVEEQEVRHCDVRADRLAAFLAPPAGPRARR